ncbi:hypothetical protein U9M48_026121 [Paspalum notatum var. saurae]|uniref:Exocyst subunit Exo70 family protein n=1 Tax=Paspalum notatum var. saurae TaxID=547442 RepID=A0AAQ3TS15_PASNO
MLLELELDRERTGEEDGTDHVVVDPEQQTKIASRMDQVTGSSCSGNGTAATTRCASRLSFVSIEETDNNKDTKFVEPINTKPRKEATTAAKEKMKQMVHEFSAASSSSSRCSVLERWFAEELGLERILHHLTGTTDGAGGSTASTGSREQLAHCSSDDARSWIRALDKIMQTIHSTSSLFPDHGLPGCICGEEEEEEDEDEEEEEPSSCRSTCLQVQQHPCGFQFARFTQETMSRMLFFVDFIAALDPRSIITRVSANGVPPAPYRKINILMRVRVALSRALPLIRLSFHSPPSAQVETIQDELTTLLSAKEQKVRHAIWTTLEDTRTCILMDSTPQEPSSDILKLTRSIMFHITFLLDNYSAVAAILSEAAILGNGKYVPETTRGARPFDSMLMEMAYSLQQKLLSISKSFPDQGLGFLFLLNNTNFMMQQLHSYFLNIAPLLIPAIKDKVEGYMDSYIQDSWAPMLSCLSNHPNTPLCFMTNYSPLSKFESELQKIYTTQRQWKVPHPELRKTLRKAITDKIVPGYKKYIEDNDVTTPKFTPQELQEMLQELFEG